MILNQIDKLLDKEQFAHDVVTTKFIGHATEIARGAANGGADIVCAIGGDGTVNEVARALVHTDTHLAIIPCGSGNGLARHLHIPLDAIRAIRLLNEGRPLRMDYGMVNLYPFFCTCGVGFDAFISQEFAKAGRRGPLTYLENILNNALRYNAETYEIDVEDERAGHTRYQAVLIACANASQYGNNVYIAPQASVHDGLMDVTIIEPFTVLEAPQIALQLLNGTIEQNSRIKTLRCRNLRIKRERAGVIHYDGNPAETGAQIDVSIVSGGLSCICPTEEGVMDVGETVQNAVVEFFSNMYARSEELFQNTALSNKRISKINLDLLNRLARKNHRT